MTRPRLDSLVKSALKYNDDEMLDEILDQLEDPNLLIAGMTPLCIAVIADRRDKIQRLLDSGANPNQRNDDGSTALSFARDTDVLRKLISKGASVEYERPIGLGTSVHQACLDNDAERCLILLDEANGVSALGLSDEFGRSPLGIAAESGNEQLLELLIDYGAPLDACDVLTASPTPLQLAIESEHKQAVEVLLAAGASLEVSHGLNFSPFKLAANNPEILGILTKYRSR